MEDDDLVIEEPASYRQVAVDLVHAADGYWTTPYPWMIYASLGSVALSISLLAPVDLTIPATVYAGIVGFSLLQMVRFWGETHE